jgi:hypothetical protein
MSVQYDITEERLVAAGYRPLHAGDDYEHRFRVVRATLPMDFTGALLWMTIKDDSIETDARAKLQLSSALSSEIQITDPIEGEFVVKFSGSGSKSTNDLEGVWKYDIQARTSTNKIVTIARGVIEFLPNLTRAV